MFLLQLSPVALSICSGVTKVGLWGQNGAKTGEEQPACPNIMFTTRTFNVLSVYTLTLCSRNAIDTLAAGPYQTCTEIQASQTAQRRINTCRLVASWNMLIMGPCSLRLFDQSSWNLQPESSSTNRRNKPLVNSVADRRRSCERSLMLGRSARMSQIKMRLVMPALKPAELVWIR